MEATASDPGVTAESDGAFVWRAQPWMGGPRFGAGRNPEGHGGSRDPYGARRGVKPRRVQEPQERDRDETSPGGRGGSKASRG